MRIAIVTVLVLSGGCGADPAPASRMPVGGGDTPSPIVETAPVAPRLVSPLEITQLALMEGVSCALSPSSGLSCWGRMTDATDDSVTARPVTLARGRDFVRIAAAGNDVCGLRGDGTLHCFSPRVRYGFSALPSFVGANGEIALPSPALEIAVGRNFVCARLTEGHVACLGFISDGTDESCEDEGTTVRCMRAMRHVVGVSGATALAAGDEHACAIVAEGHVVCWGANDSAQRGTLITPTVGASPVAGVAHATSIAAGRDFTCVTNEAGEVLCWGAMGRSARDAERDAHALVRRPAPDLAGARELVADGDTLCGVVENEARCIARPNPPAPTVIRRPTRGRSIVPIHVERPRALLGRIGGVVRIDVSMQNACVVAENGEVLCRGDNRDGSVGDPWVVVTYAPTRVLDAMGQPIADEARGTEPLDESAPSAVEEEPNVTELQFEPLPLDRLRPGVYEPNPTSVASLVRAGFARNGDAIRACLVGDTSSETFTIGAIFLRGSNRLSTAAMTSGALSRERADCIVHALRAVPWPRLGSLTSVRIPIER